MIRLYAKDAEHLKTCEVAVLTRNVLCDCLQDSKGLSFGRQEDKLGWRSQPTSSVRLFTFLTLILLLVFNPNSKNVGSSFHDHSYPAFTKSPRTRYECIH